MPTYLKLDLGSGDRKKTGFSTVDWTAETKPDFVCDLNVFPYPWADGSIDEIEMSHCLEHLEKPFKVMTELHRIMAPGGALHIKVPHFSRGFTHAEHEHGFDVTFPLYFNKNFTKSGYFGVDFKLESMRLKWFAFPYLLPYMGYGRITIALLSGINAVISFFANLSPALASRIWCFWVGGFDEIEFQFTCIK
ncbi:MAG: hypothetical protein JWL87_268 [Candidatus Adlerbacteria bacterium]|nr:hypothetical protein [Candidatus Adlerbacteria bacterium]